MKNREYVINRMGTRIDFGNSLGEAVEDLEESLESYKETRWIPVSERLPKKNQPVLITDGKTVGLTLFYQSPKDFARVTHWMPLPEPPEQEVNNED